ncbi:L-fucose isomerase (plasmid) [Fulvitalea axinellae]|uniref:L-fucose isomerase n=1 Tax=Fulvitalea axinellae TaxID=1182444 RepID=A0AAU9D288_9BACT|nr:L-fucose isomerase [Fulvitalea axinellae]
MNRYKGSLPKIGIRPTIDGRRLGVRESLEEQTMNMAQAVKALFESEIRHADGSPVEVVIADSTIGGVAESAACAYKFERENVGVSLTVTPCWCYGSETIDMTPGVPKAIWGFNGTERPGAVYLAAALAGHTQKGIPAFGIYGRDVQDSDDRSVPEDVQEKLLRFAKAGLAVATMRGKSYLSLGYVSMGIAGSEVDSAFFQNYLGMRTEFVDMSEVKRRLELDIYDKEEFEKALAWTKENCKEGEDPNPELELVGADEEACVVTGANGLATARRSEAGSTTHRRNDEEKEEIWKTCVKMALIGKDLMIGNPKLEELGYGEEALGRNALAGGFQGQRQWTDFMPNGDYMEAILASSFDWNGPRQPFNFATENDSLNAVVMMFGNLLTGTAQMFSDVRTYWSPEAVKEATGKELEGSAKNGIIHLINSGPSALDFTGRQRVNGEPAVKPFWELDEKEVQDCLDNTTWRAGVEEYFRGSGYSTEFYTEGGMPITMSRVNLVKGLGPVLQIAEGHTVELDDDMNRTLADRTNPTWPTTWFVPRVTGKGAFTDVYSVMANWGANHGAISYGHIGADLITLASMLRIPVCMHNVPDEKVFRPSAWNAFGMDKEGADYRACENFGPLY